MSNKEDKHQPLELHGTIRIASDIHLGVTIPKTCRAFYAFLQDSIQNADHLILAGDIFDYWIGDDKVDNNPPSWLLEAITQLQAFGQQKPLYLMTGNRDFLLGEQFAKRVNAQLLPLELIIKTDSGNIHLSHGDQFCSDDKWFMFFRHITHNRLIQKLFLTLPLKARLWIAHKAREKSQAKEYDYSTYDGVNPSSVDEVFRQNPDVPQLIHGHTHHPGVFTHTIDKKSYTRHVLSDWDYDHTSTPRADYFEIDKDGIQRKTWLAA